MNTRKLSFRFWLSTVLLAASCLTVHADNYFFRQIDTRQGLSQNTVNCIVQDRQGFVWMATKGGLNRFDGVGFRVFRTGNSALTTNFINTLAEDHDGRLWVGTERGVYSYNPWTESLTPLTETIEGTQGRKVTCSVRSITVTDDGSILIGTTGEGVLRYDPAMRRLHCCWKELLPWSISHVSTSTDRIWVGAGGINLFYTYATDKPLTAFTDDKGEQPFAYIDVNDLQQTDNEMYVATDHGLFRFDLLTYHTERLVEGFFRTLCLSADGRSVWAGTQDGLYILNLRTGEMTHIRQPETDDIFSISDNAIYDIMADAEGGIWIGSYFGGVNYLPAQQLDFEKFYPRQDQLFIGRRVREMCQDDNGRIWIGTEDKGLLCYNPADGNMRPVETHLLTNNIHGLSTDGHQWLWVGAFDGGLERIGLNDGSHRTYLADGRPGSLVSNYIFSLLHDDKGTLWVGTTQGLMRYQPETDSFEMIDDVPHTFIYHIGQTHDHLLWLCTYNDGLYCYNPTNGKLQHYAYTDGSPGTLPDTKVISLFEDSKHRLWVMTHDGGLLEMDRQTGQFNPVVMSDNERLSLVFRVVEDRQGNLWCSTSSGLVCYNPADGTHRHYTTAHGLQTDHFNYQSGLIDKSGYLYFGTVNGLVRFHPQHLRTTDTQLRIALSALYLFNQLQQPQAEGSPLTTSIDLCERLDLSHQQNSFTIVARVLSYISPELNQLRYRLEGYDTDWRRVEQGTGISYANLPYGTYTLHLQGINSDGKECSDERTLVIVVHPPFYLSTFAKIIYLLLAVGLLLLAWRLFQRKNRERMERAQERLEQEKQRELYDSKISFFTNIAHEIRTPLTLIKSPLDHLLDHPEQLTPKQQSDLQIMQLNTTRLVTLVSQLLDFRKAEGHTLSVNLQQVNVSELTHTLVNAFQPALRERALTLQSDIQPDIHAVLDRDLFGKIIANLLSNAYKYASSTIRLRLLADDEHLTFDIANDGTPVPAAMREEIFQPFTRYESEENATVMGTGLGLALTRTLAELHHGSVGMVDDPELPNRFVLTLPLQQEEAPLNLSEGETSSADLMPSPNGVEMEGGQGTSGGEVSPTLLIVEDNDQLRQFLANHFQATYHTLQAADGQQAIGLLEEHSVSIIISDIMMPRMDGIQLLQHVKENVETSHIPVVLLTAKTTIQSRIEGLRHGADAYIDKPFDMPLLEQTLQTLLQNIRRLYTAFSQRPFAIQVPTTALSDIETDFIRRLSQTVIDNMENPEYNVDSLAAAMNMSRSSLNRKIKGALGMTPNDYIRVERLKRAVALLQSGRYKINEVCYMVGFNTPSYFAKCFQRQYGILPSDIEAATQG